MKETIRNALIYGLASMGIKILQFNFCLRPRLLQKKTSHGKKEEMLHNKIAKKKVSR
ncbi:MAG: hypothetical protein WCJ45_00640 [bacterium]